MPDLCTNFRRSNCVQKYESNTKCGFFLSFSLSHPFMVILFQNIFGDYIVTLCGLSSDAYTFYEYNKKLGEKKLKQSKFVIFDTYSDFLV
jgi:hypothetical protein